MSVVDGADRPADDKSREEIEDRRQIQLAAVADDQLRRVADPPLIRPLGGELAIQDIVGHRLIGIADRRQFEAFARPRPQPVLLHQADDTPPARLIERTSKSAPADKDGPKPESERLLLAADTSWGVAAGLWIASGLARVFLGGKEPAFYWRNGFSG
jgi:hypothetical protein